MKTLLATLVLLLASSSAWAQADPDYTICTQNIECPTENSPVLEILIDGSGGDGIYETGDEFDLFLNISEYTQTWSRGASWRVLHEDDCLEPITSATDWLGEPPTATGPVIDTSGAWALGSVECPECDRRRFLEGYNCGLTNNPDPDSADLVTSFRLRATCAPGRHRIVLDFGSQRNCAGTQFDTAIAADEVYYHVPEPGAVGLLAGLGVLGWMGRRRRE